MAERFNIIESEESVAGGLMLAMTDLSYHAQELLIDDYPALLADNHDIAGMHEGCPPLLGYMSDPCESFRFNYPCQEDYFYNSNISSPYMEEEVLSASSPYIGEEPHYGNWRNWDIEYDFGPFSRCWDDSFSCGNGSYSKGHDHDSALEKTEFQYEEQEDGFVSHCGIAESYQYDDENPWSGLASWFGKGSEEESDYQGNQEAKYPSSYIMDDLGFFQGIFGYWPCMTRNQKAYSEQNQKDMLKQIPVSFLS